MRETPRPHAGAGDIIIGCMSVADISFIEQAKTGDRNTENFIVQCDKLIYRREGFDPGLTVLVG